jgi:CheY-like chemotaxis protein
MKRFVLDDSPERLEAFRRRFPDCVTATNYQEAVQALTTNGRFDEVWLDHDLGQPQTGCDVAYWLATTLPPSKLPSKAIVHSWNSSGAKAIAVTLQGAGLDVTIWPFDPDDLR